MIPENCTNPLGLAISGNPRLYIDQKAGESICVKNNKSSERQVSLQYFLAIFKRL